jgi:hypothetical protein
MEKLNYVYALPPLENFHQESFSIIYLFIYSPSHLFRNHDANSTLRAYISALDTGFFQVAKNCQVFCQTIGGVFLTFLLKIKNDNSIWQTIGNACRMDIPRLTTLVGTRTDYLVGPWDYSTCATRHLLA